MAAVTLYARGKNKIDTTERNCKRCSRPMVTRRRHAELGGVRGDGVKLVAHSTRGYCRGCADALFRKRRPRPQLVRNPRPSMIDKTETTCPRCGRAMVSRRRYAELNGQRSVVARGSHGYCRGCTDAITRPGRNPKRERGMSKAERAEEWAFLKSCGVTIHEAAQRLGVTVRTLEEYGL